VGISFLRFARNALVLLVIAGLYAGYAPQQVDAFFPPAGPLAHSIHGLLPSAIVGGDQAVAATAPPERPPVSVLVGQVEKKDLPWTIDEIGTAQAISSVALRPRYDAMVEKVLVADGASVKAGDTLIELDSSQLKAQLAGAQAQLAKDQAQLEQAQRDVTRDTDLVARAATPVLTLDQAKTAVATTLAAIEGDDGDLDHVSYLAELEFRAGNSEEALRLIRDALARHRKRDERLHILVDLSNESAYLLALDRYDEACSEAREALARAVREKDPLWTAFALLHLAAAGALLGDRRHAARLMGFVDGRMAELQHQRGYTEEHERERVMPLLRRAFKDGELASLMAEGAALSEDAATAEALEIAAVGRRPASEEQR